MNALKISLLVSTLVVVPAAMAGGAEPVVKEHPGVVALSQDAAGEWVYRSFPQITRLYVHRQDRPGKSLCDDRCASTWPPLLADDGERGRRVGAWSVIKRDDGQAQWAYKGQPVYLRFHDMPEDIHAVEVEGFRQLKP
jgi:predicted lipoprotein with Yx(FWY)xxD motif